MSITTRKSAKPSDVRTWAAANGFTTGKRGKFSADLIRAYNRGNSLKYIPAAFAPVKSVKVKVNGKTRPRTVNVSLARKALNDAGITTGKRGRLTQAQIQAAFDLA